MDAVPARLHITAGPDEGKSFGLTADLIHIGTGAENQIVLSDNTLAEHQASIAGRSGRFAIYVPPGQRVEVEGSAVPNERWVWLPATATLRMGAATLCRFESAAQGGVNGGATASSAPTTTVPTLSASQKSASADAPVAPEEGTPTGSDLRKRGARRKRAAQRKSQVARFITDRPGDPLVKLGEDGQLPELALKEGSAAASAEAPREKNPLVLYGVLTCSFVMSLGLLLIEPTGTTTSTSARVEAREKLQEFFGEDGSDFEPHQRELRQALIDAARGDTAEERAHYRRVLHMLNAADIRDPANLNGLTGRYTGRGRASDDELRKLLQTLLAN